MPEVSPVARALAHRVLLDGVGERLEPAALAAAAERADARLRARLIDLIGQAGYTALVARAVRLAQGEAPVLAGVTVDATGGGAKGSLRGIRGVVESARASADLRAAAAGLSALLAHVIGLLITFIGEDLALRIGQRTRRWRQFDHPTRLRMDHRPVLRDTAADAPHLLTRVPVVHRPPSLPYISVVGGDAIGPNIMASDTTRRPTPVPRMARAWVCGS